jgi:hypothetical protein
LKIVFLKPKSEINEVINYSVIRCQKRSKEGQVVDVSQCSADAVLGQGCQKAYLHTKYPNLSLF